MLNMSFVSGSAIRVLPFKCFFSRWQRLAAMPVPERAAERVGLARIARDIDGLLLGFSVAIAGYDDESFW